MPTETDHKRPFTDAEMRNPLDNLSINGTNVTVVGLEIDLSNYTLSFENGQIHYKAGIPTEICAVGKHYREVTEEFETKLANEYRFRLGQPATKPWFHKTEFWPYHNDSARNRYHHHRYSTTDTDGSLDNPNEKNNATPFDENKVIAYYDNDEQRVRVFHTESPTAKHPTDVANRVFAPTLNFYLVYQRQLICFDILATPVTDDRLHIDDDKTDIDPTYISDGKQIRTRDNHLILYETEYRLNGPVWTAITEYANQHVAITPHSFDIHRELIVNPDVKLPGNYHHEYQSDEEPVITN